MQIGEEHIAVAVEHWNGCCPFTEHGVECSIASVEECNKCERSVEFRKTKEEFVFFHGGIFGNWYLMPFTLECAPKDRVGSTSTRFNDSETYFMWRKALHFEAWDTAKKILLTDNPKTARMLGRLFVPKFDQVEWDKVKEGIMCDGLMLKFTSSDEARDKLVATFPKTLVESSPYDKVWGIGLSERSSLLHDRTKWKGQNLLGKCLMIVRSRIMKGDTL